MFNKKRAAIHKGGMMDSRPNGDRSCYVDVHLGMHSALQCLNGLNQRLHNESKHQDACHC